MSKCYHCESGDSHACGEKCLEHYKREVDRLEKRDSQQSKALKAAKKAFEFSHGYSVKGETTKIGRAYKMVVGALKN